MYMETDTIEFMIHVPQYWNAIGNPPGTLGRSTSVLTCMETDTLGFMLHVPQYWNTYSVFWPCSTMVHAMRGVLKVSQSTE